MLRSKLSAVISAIVMLAAGVLLFLFPGESLVIAARVLGGAVLLYGVVGVISYLLAESADRSYLKLVFYILIGLVGAAILITPGFIIDIFPILVGILIVISGIDTIVTCFAVKRAGGSMGLLLVLGLITLALGALIIANPFKVQATLVRIIGAVLVYGGVVDIIEVIKSRKLPKAGEETIAVDNA